jgi:hypothetical protein
MDELSRRMVLWAIPLVALWLVLMVVQLVHVFRAN